MTTPLLVASPNAVVGFAVAMERLRDEGRALDGVEIAVRTVEDNPEDHTVGYGGLLNLIGQVELDALIMDGHTLAAGAVAALKGFRHPVSIARRVSVTSSKQPKWIPQQNARASTSGWMAKPRCGRFGRPITDASPVRDIHHRFFCQLGLSILNRYSPLGDRQSRSLCLARRLSWQSP
jgi:beta-aspartyl-peptidase (threonine type)